MNNEIKLSVETSYWKPEITSKIDRLWILFFNKRTLCGKKNSRNDKYDRSRKILV